MEYVIFTVLFTIAFSILYFLLIKRKPKKEKIKIPNLDAFDSKIEVNLKDCKVLSSEYVTDQDLLGEEHYEATIIDLIVNSMKPAKNKAVVSYILYQKGKNRFFGGPLRKSKTALELKLMNEPFANLYFKKEEPTNYFMDVQFLDDE
jgi:prepilin signal peptidase PulO-like enzyme (type II secretory pathway)